LLSEIPLHAQVLEAVTWIGSPQGKAMDWGLFGNLVFGFDRGSFGSDFLLHPGILYAAPQGLVVIEVDPELG